MTFRASLMTGLAALGLAASYVLGAYSFSHDLWPLSQLRDAVHVASGQAVVRDHIDSHGRLVARSDKQSIACPVQTPDTAVILFIGQSILSNSAGQRSISAKGDKIVSWFDGSCTLAESPLLGTTGTSGEAMTPIGNELIARDAFARVILAPSAIGGTRIQQWVPGGDLAEMFSGVLDKLSGQYRITHIVWDQGEEDFAEKTSQESYTRDFNTLVRMIRDRGIEAPIFVTVASRCDDETRWRPDNEIARAQKALVAPERKILAGLNTDELLGPRDRFDDCHLSASGVEVYARASAQLIAARRN